jgi:hypothetical protein
VLVSTLAALWSDNEIKFHDSVRLSANERETAQAKAEGAKAHERIAELSTQGEQLRKDAAEANARLGLAQADIAKANASIAEADARTKEAELKLEQLRRAVRPRGFGREFFELVKDEPGCPVRISYVETAGDGASLAMQLKLALPKEKGWVAGDPELITAREPFMAGSPQGLFRNPDFVAAETTMMGTGINPSGVSVVIGPGFEPPTAWRDLKTGATPVGALIRAFLASVGSVSYGFDTSLPVGTLRVVIGPRP